MQTIGSLSHPDHADHRQLGSYRVLRVVHASGKSEVLAGESAMGDAVILKRCSPLQAENERATLMALKRADAECSTFVRLLDCIASTQEADPWNCLVLEAGVASLASWLLERNWSPSWVEVLDVGDAVGRALAWLHAQGLCHTDLKPSNVIRCTRTWKLCDFAAAAKPGASCGELTWQYSAPEQVRAVKQGHKALASHDADVWAYSKMLYEMAAGSIDAVVAAHSDDPKTMSMVVGLKDPVVNEHSLRFPALKTVLLASLSVRTPRPSMERIMAKGFWTGASTSATDVGETAAPSAAAGGKAQGKREMQLEKAVQELLDTEEEYCARMRSFVDAVVLPLKNAIKEGEVTEVHAESLRVFVDMENLLRLNAFFLEQLRTRYKSERIQCVGEIMSEFAKTLLRNYEDYVSRYPSSNQCLQENKRDSRSFSETLDTSLMSLPRAQGGGAGGAGLDFYLILPVQRLMRYKLLLERIVSLTDDEGAFLNLQTALGAVCDTIDAINDSTPLVDTSGLTPADSLRWSVSGTPDRRREVAGAWTWGGGIGIVVAGAVGLGVAWGLFRLLRDREQTELRLRELQITAETAEQLAAAERLRAEQAASAVQQAKETTKTVGAATAGAVAVAALLLLSDERVKCRVRQVYFSPSGLPVYRYAYRWAPEHEWEGVIAQEVLRVRALQRQTEAKEAGWVMLGGGIEPVSAGCSASYQSGCLPAGLGVHLVKDVLESAAVADTTLLHQTQAACRLAGVQMPEDLLAVDYSKIDVVPRRVR